MGGRGRFGLIMSLLFFAYPNLDVYDGGYIVISSFQTNASCDVRIVKMVGLIPQHMAELPPQVHGRASSRWARLGELQLFGVTVVAAVQQRESNTWFSERYQGYIETILPDRCANMVYISDIWSISLTSRTSQSTGGLLMSISRRLSWTRDRRDIPLVPSPPQPPIRHGEGHARSCPTAPVPEKAYPHFDP